MTKAGLVVLGVFLIIMFFLGTFGALSIPDERRNDGWEEKPVREIRLDDGTRCVLYKNSIDCNWVPKG